MINLIYENAKAYLKEFGVEPKDYVVNKFKDYDIIFLGENHAIKENLLFVKELIPLLYEAGVYHIGMEFGASEDQKALDELVMGPSYDENLARELMFRYNTIFPYKEYWDLYKEAWQLNQSLPKEARKFRILNLSYQYNWKDYKGIKTPITVAKVFHKGGTERYRYRIIKDEIIAKNEKILILTGTIHAFTKYQYPTFDYLYEDFVRLDNAYFGNLVYQDKYDKVYSILLHTMFYNKDEYYSNRQAANGQMEKIMVELNNQPLGFDLVDTPVGLLPDNSYYAYGHPDFKIKDLMNGYIFLKPLNQLSGCTIDYDFLKHHSLTEVLDQFPDPEWHNIPQSLSDYWKLVEDYVNIKERYKLNE